MNKEHKTLLPESGEPGTTPRMWTAAMIAGGYPELGPHKLKRLEGQIITALRESQEPLLQALETALGKVERAKEVAREYAQYSEGPPAGQIMRDLLKELEA